MNPLVKKMKSLIYILSIILFGSCNSISETIEFQNGDIIFQESKSSQSKAIQLATNSRYSHVGIIYKKNNSYYVYEAIQPVSITPIQQWINRGKDKHYVVKRLKDTSLLTVGNLKKMQYIGHQYKGKDYDLYFGWSNERIYCSELVYKIYRDALNIELGELQTLSDFNLNQPAVHQKLKERYGDNIPLKEPVISPAAIFESDLLKTIFEN